MAKRGRILKSYTIDNIRKKVRGNPNLVKNMTRKQAINLHKSLTSEINKEQRKVLKDKTIVSPYQRVQETFGRKPTLKLKTNKGYAKMKTSDIKREAEVLVAKAQYKTIKYEEVVKFNKDFKEQTGTDFKDITYEDWNEIRKLIEEGYASSEAIDIVLESKTSGKTIEDIKSEKQAEEFEQMVKEYEEYKKEVLDDDLMDYFWK